MEKKWNCPLSTVISYTQVPFKAGLTTFKLQSNLYVNDTEGNMKMCPLWESPLYTGINYELLKLPFIDSDLLHTGAH